MRIAGLQVVLCAALAACGPQTSDAPAEADDYSARMAQEHKNDRPRASPAATSGAAAPVKSDTVEYAVVRNRPVSGYLAYPAQAEGGLPAVLLFHEWWGLNDNIRAMADQLAGQGYVALAVDLYLGQVAQQPEAARSLMETAMADGAMLDRHLRQAQSFLKEQVKATRIGTLGWCLGGTMSLRSALIMPEQIDAAVIYYGHVGSDPASLARLAAPVLGLFGGADQGIPVEQVRAFEQALKALRKPAEIHVYEGAAHAFANPSGGNYHAQAAQDAWAKTLAFLGTHLKDG